MAVTWDKRTNTSAATPTLPTGITTGNLLVIAAIVYASPLGSLSTPSGWTLGASSAPMGLLGKCTSYVFYKVAGASETAPTLTGTFSNIQVEFSVVSGAHLTTPVSASTFGTPSATGSVPTPASTAAAANSLAAYLMFDFPGGGVAFVSAPAGSTSRYNDPDSGGGFAEGWADATVAAGTVAAAAFTRANVTYTAVGHALIIAPVPPALAPVADFTGTPLTGAVPLSVTFTDTSTNTPTSWLWDFGDGTTSTSQNPTHSFAAGGTYTVVLTATNATGSNAKTRTGYVTATESIIYVAGGGVTIW